MIRRWLRQWGWTKVPKSVKEIDALIDATRQESLRARQQVEGQAAQLAKMQRELENAAVTIRKLEQALDAAQERLRTAEDIVIPGLVSANQTFRETWDAQSANLVMRAAALGPGRGEE